MIDERARDAIVLMDVDNAIARLKELPRETLDNTDEQGYTLLHHAVNMRLEEVVRELARMGADVNKASTIDFLVTLKGSIPAPLCLVGGRTPLHVAAAEAEPELFDLLISLGASPSLEIQDRNGMTPGDLQRRSSTMSASQILQQDLEGVRSRRNPLGRLTMEA